MNATLSLWVRVCSFLLVVGTTVPFFFDDRFLASHAHTLMKGQGEEIRNKYIQRMIEYIFNMFRMFLLFVLLLYVQRLLFGQSSDPSLT